MKMPFEWVVGDSSKGLHGDRAHVYDETGHRELHHVKGHYSGVKPAQRQTMTPSALACSAAHR